MITNYSLNPERRFDFELGVETDDLQRAVDLGVEIIGSLSFVLNDPAPDGWVNKIGDSNMVLWFGGWINQNETSLVKARAEAIRKIKRAFEAEGIGLPEPIYRLRIDEGTTGTVKSAQKGVSTKTRSKSTKSAVAKHADEPERDVSPDRQLEKKIIEAERLNKDDDLMSDDALQEIAN